MQAFPFAAVVYHITLKASDTYSYETYHYLGAPTLFARLDTCSSIYICLSAVFIGLVPLYLDLLRAR